MRGSNETNLAEAGSAKLVRAVDEDPAERALRRQQAIDAMPSEAPDASPNCIQTEGHGEPHSPTRHVIDTKSNHIA
jgi:hypothetical protein